MTSLTSDISFATVLRQNIGVEHKALLLSTRANDKSLRTTRLLEELHTLLIDGCDEGEIMRICLLFTDPPEFEHIIGDYGILGPDEVRMLSTTYESLNDPSWVRGCYDTLEIISTKERRLFVEVFDRVSAIDISAVYYIWFILILTCHSLLRELELISTIGEIAMLSEAY